ncbi:somatomedin-B and thrombospondin type-1 domain-containing protein isoform X3 [Cuculus canorus]|uniref:somatomedin-B and thrombospondin type-1 domain-containing protein isoform X3 n=1 Tax=Cuculus canorus TaxID=55661 RepID=UPI0023AB2BD7|nr:somatomedin-B and thrombospondin type-1 domain-containing protein isoform X3 [Cuculus canorus]
MLSFPSAPLSGPLTAVGCVVGSWGPWSRCSSPCGVGSKARSRQVTIPPWHGGEPCPDLKQRRGCLGEHPTCGAAKGNTSPMGIPRPSCMSIPAAHPKVSVTIPVPYPGCSAARGGQGIAQLLWPGLQGSLVESQAAAAGGAIWVGPPCRGQDWTRWLHRDKRVCVECWGDAAHRRSHCTGHGLQGASRSRTAITDQ